MNYQNFLFDLDGTISESREGVVNSFIFALKKLNLYSGETNTEMQKVVGPPLRHSFIDLYGLKGDELEKAISAYREYFRDKGIYENYPYEGIQELLGSLKQNGARMFVATCKPAAFARKIIKNYKFDNLFEYISGALMDGKRETKPEVIEYIIKRFKLDKSKTIMIGDRFHDIEGAHLNKIKCVAVTYGCGSREEATEYKADYIVNSVDELKNFLETAKY